MDSCFTNERMTAVSGKNGAICSSPEICESFPLSWGAAELAMWWSFGGLRAGSPCTGRRDCISHSQWSISGVKNEATQPMHFSFVARLCVWKRCCAVTSHRGRFITAGPREEKW